MYRFVDHIESQAYGRMNLKDQGYGLHSAKVLAKIIGANQSSITTLDLSMNSCHLGLDLLVPAIKKNDHLISLKLKNNNIDGRRYTKELYQLVHEHPSLTSVELGNSENVKNRNRLYNEGFKALIEGIADSKQSLISELHVPASNLTQVGLQSLSLLTASQVDLQVLDISNNDLGNDFVPCLHAVIPSLVSLNLSNTKLTSKGCAELGRCLQEAEHQMCLRFLDISQNKIETEGFASLLTSLSRNGTISSINASGNQMTRKIKQFSQVSHFLA